MYKPNLMFAMIVALSVLTLIVEIEGAQKKQKGKQGQRGQKSSIKYCKSNEDCESFLNPADAATSDIVKACYRVDSRKCNSTADPTCKNVCGMAYLNLTGAGFLSGNQTARIPDSTNCSEVKTDADIKKLQCKKFRDFAAKQLKTFTVTSFEPPTFICTPKGSSKGYITCPVQVTEPADDTATSNGDPNRKKLPPPYCTNDDDCEAFLPEKDIKAVDIFKSCFNSDPSSKKCNAMDANCEHVCGFSYLKSNSSDIMATQTVRNPNPDKCVALKSNQNLAEATVACNSYRDFQTAKFTLFNYESAPVIYSCEGAAGSSFIACPIQGTRN